MGITDLLIQLEGREQYVYQDSRSLWTIGVGRCVDRRNGPGLSDDEIDYLLANDIRTATIAAKLACPSFVDLSESRQAVLVCMAFQLGAAGLEEFKDMLACISKQDWIGAANAMRSSKWDHQTPSRVEIMAKMMETG